MKKIFIITCLFLFIPSLLYTTKKEEPKEGTPAPTEKEVEVKGKFKVKIEEKKPMIKLFYDPFEALATFIKKKEFIYDKQLEINIEQATALYPVLATEQLIKPWLHGIVREEIALFNPIYGGDVYEWKIEFRDEKGSLFKKWEGKGTPPKNIYWNGRGEDESMINPGLIYELVGEAKDSLGNVSKTLSRKFILKGILYKEMGEWTIALRGERIWTSRKSTEISKEGYQLLREAADIAKQLFTRQLVVEVYSITEALSRKRGEIVMNFLLNNMVIPKYSVTHVSGFVDDVYKSDYIKIKL